MGLARVTALGLVVASLAAAPAAQAQKVKEGGTLIGPWAGVNLATFGGSSASDVSTLTGLAVGGQLQRYLTPDFFVRIGAFYAMRGTSFSNPSGTTKLNYVEFPVVLGYAFTMQSSQVKPYIMAGGQFGFKASCQVETGGSSTECNTALGTSLTSTDFGFIGGAGVAFPMGSGQIMVDARYFIGLTNLVSSAGGGAELKNKGFTIVAGYMIPIGR